MSMALRALGDRKPACGRGSARDLRADAGSSGSDAQLTGLFSPPTVLAFEPKPHSGFLGIEFSGSPSK
jgi:hypothetical protein